MHRDYPCPIRKLEILCQPIVMGGKEHVARCKDFFTMRERSVTLACFQAQMEG